MHSNGDARTDHEDADADDSPTAIISRAFDEALCDDDADPDGVTTPETPNPFPNASPKDPEKTAGVDTGCRVVCSSL